jgi:hypothetical protein
MSDAVMIAIAGAVAAIAGAAAAFRGDYQGRVIRRRLDDVLHHSRVLRAQAVAQAYEEGYADGVRQGRHLECQGITDRPPPPPEKVP